MKDYPDFDTTFFSDLLLQTKKEHTNPELCEIINFSKKKKKIAERSRFPFTHFDEIISRHLKDIFHLKKKRICFEHFFIMKS